MIRFASALALVFAFTVSASAQDARRMTTERFRFDPGTFGGAVTETITDGGSRRYLVSVRAGQRLSVTIENYGEDGAAVLQVYAPGRAIQARYAAPDGDGERFDLMTWYGQLSRSGDYQIVVYPMSDGRYATYELFVTVQ